MWAVVLLGSVLHFHVFLSVQCAPASERRTGKAPQGFPHSNVQTGLKKRARQKQETLDQDDLVKSALASQNGSDFWKRPRCGVPDYPVSSLTLDVSRYILKKRRGGLSDAQGRAGLSDAQRRKRYALFGGRWEKNNLSYKIERFPWQMPEDKVRRVLRAAFGIWSAVTPLSFREVTEKPDIVIDFARYWHGDTLPFDGPGGILAHAFFPRTQREGEVHFDYDENWTLGNNVGTDLLQVAAHEFGHVLGLQHSLVPGAIMSPFYSDTYPLRLGEDDVKGIQYLYGPRPRRENTPPPPPPPRENTPPPDITETNDLGKDLPDACRTSFDAVSMIRGELYFFKSRFVWRIRDGQLQDGYPALSTRHWRGFPDSIDAAYEDKSGNVWFFKGNSYWVFDAGRKITGPDSIQQLGLPVSEIHAAVNWAVDRDETIFLFNPPFYWSFSPNNNRVNDAHPAGMHKWAGLPSRFDGAFRDKYGYTNFVSGQDYWKFDPVTLTVLKGYPRIIGVDFFSCSASLYK
ncbi:stromelysin-3-like [Cololabis saira]|uniref:stromelysin-3-like n=1 Tax=Cololabis saira TaxID=129043 RepID=UPI002AD4515A|nr:stromelysin-3-like [Cololabis saira]